MRTSVVSGQWSVASGVMYWPNVVAILQQPAPEDWQLATGNWLLIPYRSLSPYAEAGSTWFEVGPGTALPCSSIFMPKLRPIEDRNSLISFNDLRSKLLVFRISASVF